MATITSTLTITSNSSTATASPGPLSMALSLSQSFSPTIVTVKSANQTISTTAASLFTDALQAEGDTAGTHGALIYMKNTSSSDYDIYIGFEASGSTAAEMQSAGAATRLGTLKQGEFMFFPYDFAGDITIDSENAAATLEYFFFSRT
jgi:hypothetical protein|tara:strand:- start:1042 stop:1485 length:444 start_codon:yes stop_codon:yes gene_type:complete